jgi:hypothetical protein
MVSEYMNMDEVVAILTCGLCSKPLQLQRWCSTLLERMRENLGGELAIKVYQF